MRVTTLHVGGFGRPPPAPRQRPRMHGESDAEFTEDKRRPH